VDVQLRHSAATPVDPVTPEHRVAFDADDAVGVLLLEMRLSNDSYRGTSALQVRCQMIYCCSRLRRRRGVQDIQGRRCRLSALR